MKIVVGGIYKSTITAHITGLNADKTQQIGPPEEWEIHFQLTSGKFLGKQINRIDSHIAWREFDEDGRDGTTTTGNYRNLIPNTAKKEYWGYSFKQGDYTSVGQALFTKKEDAESLIKRLYANYKCKVFSFVREEEV